ncbi:unnamed protein product [Brassica napus]|uniref:(rape) hypothetical protein n=1 Tax=Brassica napus TaxID=3708 RepID=A0A816SZJ2_BRANA|nr:unnamed protein product [Brassica napus]
MKFRSFPLLARTMDSSATADEVNGESDEFLALSLER